MDVETRRRRWGENAIARELKVMEALPLANTEKPASAFFICLLKLASLSKGGFISKENAIVQAKYACRHLNLPAKVIDRQWERAYTMAQPREPSF